MATDSKSMWMGRFASGIILPALLCTFGVDARILEGPGNHTVPIGANATFHCIAQAQGEESFAYWKINEESVNDQGTFTRLTEEGFIFEESERDSTTSKYNLTLSFNAIPQYNDTNITCVAFSDKWYNSSPAKLTVMGQPSPPDPQLRMLNATTLQLSWLPPFTWMGYPIVNYSIEMNNRATGEVTNWAINATSAGSNVSSPVTFDYSTPYGEVVQRCEELVFTVYAANNLGQSEPGEVHGGFPIVPGNSSIEGSVTFQSDGTPQLRLRIQLPNICSFQDLVYTITIQRVNYTADIVIGPMTVRGRTDAHEVIDSGLVVNAVYSVLVDMDTVTGSISSSTTFKTHFQPTTESPDTTATSGAGIKVAIGVFTAMFITVVSGLVLILCACAIHKRKAEDNSAEKACKAMVTNPIYEGPLYETIQPELCTLTTPGPAPDLMESRYLDKPIHPAMPNEASENGTAIAGGGTLSQSRGGENMKREDCSLETDCIHIPGATPSSDDNYTVMSPVGTLSYSLQGGWGIPDHSDPEEPDKTGFE